MVKVKQLNWAKFDQRSSGGHADTPMGHYHVWTHHEANGRWFWRLEGPYLSTPVAGETWSEADSKAKAQEHFDASVLSCLADPS